MGFEVNYIFCDKDENGDYDKNNLKSFKKKVGDPFEEVSLEKLASSIMAQLARRDIFISDVEVFELSKKKVSFKETKLGLVLKNKKFLFDSLESPLSSFENEDAQTTQPKQVFQPSNSLSASVDSSVTLENKTPITTVVFSPEIHQMQEIKRNGLNLTIDKKYSVYKKAPSKNGLGDSYLIIDDKNKEQWVSDLYFIPGTVNLLGDKELGFSDSPSCSRGGNLLWDDSPLDTNMPNIRRGR